MISIAKLYLLYFASDPQTNNNRTFIVDRSMNAGGINTIGFKGEISSHGNLVLISLSSYDTIRIVDDRIVCNSGVWPL